MALSFKRSMFLSSSPNPLIHQKNHFFINPVFVPLGNRTRVTTTSLRKSAKFPVVAAISEDLVKGSSSSSTASNSNTPVVPEKPVKFKVRAVVTVRNKIKEDFKEQLVKHLDALSDRIGRNVVLQLFSTQIDPKTNAEKKSNEAVLKDWSKKLNVKAERVNYTAEFTVDSSFGEAGAITVINNHQKEFYLESITIEGFAAGTVHFPCNSWVQARKDLPGKRIFFSNKISSTTLLHFQVCNLQYHSPSLSDLFSYESFYKMFKKVMKGGHKKQISRWVNAKTNQISKSKSVVNLCSGCISNNSVNNF